VGVAAALEVDRGWDGVYAHDDQGEPGNLAYIYVEYRL
jgi:hypothetical protein